MPNAIRARAALLISALLAVLFIVSDVRAEAFDVNDTTWEGGSRLLEIARAELGATRVQAVAVLNWEEVGPEDGVLAIHPMQAMDADETSGFMKAGGRLAILDDYGNGDETLKRFHIERAPPPSRPVSALRNRPALAIAEPVIDVVAGHSGGPHPVVAHVQQLVTNHPTGLRHPHLSEVLRIRAIGEPDVIVAVAGQVGKGRLFAMSDPSALINEMLRYPGNRAFVAGLVRYLVDDDGSGPKKGKLYIVTNRFEEEGSFGGKSTIRKDFDAQLKAIANAIADARRDGLPTWLLIAIAALLTVGIVVWVVRASARPYKSALPRYARPTPLVAQGGIAGRFALLAAPSSPRALTLLELKSALFEAITQKLDLATEPSADGLLRAIQRTGKVSEMLEAGLRDVLSLMQAVEASVVGGRHAHLSRAQLARAARVVEDVLAACGIDSHGPMKPDRPKRAVDDEMVLTVALPPSKPDSPSPPGPPGDRAG